MTEQQQKLVEDNMKLVYYVVNKNYLGNEDYISVGTIGLIKGVKGYDETRGFCLSTYLITCIKNEIAHEYRRDKNPRNCVSLDNTANDDNLTYIDMIADDIDVEEMTLKNERINLLYEAVSKLSYKEQYIIINYYGLYDCPKKKQKEIAVELNIKPGSVTKMHLKALKKIKKYMEDKYAR